jgi:UDP-perosamine 4-acetyltransferase
VKSDLVDLRGKPCVLMGAGGHARVVADLAVALGAEIVGICDPVLTSEGLKRWQDLEVLGDDDYLLSISPADVLLLNGVGKMPGSSVRAELYRRFAKAGFTFPPLVHPAAWVSPGVSVGSGVQVMAGAVIQTGAFLGCNAIVNTASSVDHDSHIGAHVHVAPGVTVCGDVTIGDHAFVGAGATIIQGVSIPANGFVKAGSLVAKDWI